MQGLLSAAARAKSLSSGITATDPDPGSVYDIIKISVIAGSQEIVRGKTVDYQTPVPNTKLTEQPGLPDRRSEAQPGLG